MPLGFNSSKLISSVFSTRKLKDGFDKLVSTEVMICLDSVINLEPVSKDKTWLGLPALNQLQKKVLVESQLYCTTLERYPLEPQVSEWERYNTLCLGGILGALKLLVCYDIE
jgi:hypothetical protein